jgi:hypothetical protein
VDDEPECKEKGKESGMDVAVRRRVRVRSSMGESKRGVSDGRRMEENAGVVGVGAVGGKVCVS